MYLNSLLHIILLTCLKLASCEFHSSVHELTKLANYEYQLLGKMEKFVSLNENKLDHLKKKLSEFEREHEEALESKASYFEDPINRYLLTKRLSVDWQRMESFLDHVGSNTLKSIDRFRMNNTFPGENDFTGAIEGILRLQSFYRLNTKDIAQGIVGGVKYSTELSARDCFEFGKYALQMEKLLAAHAWLSEALDRFEIYKPSAIDGYFEKPDILEIMAEVKFKLSDFQGAVDYSYSLNLWRPNNSSLIEMYNFYVEHASTRPSYAVETEHEPIPFDLYNINDYTAYQLTCSEHLHRLPSEDRKLRCKYLFKTHPFLLLAPLKVEELALDPLLLLFHEVIYDSEIDEVLELAKDKMERARVVDGAGTKVTADRTSQSVFFPKDMAKVFQTIDERVADMTGLDMITAEGHQIVNYGIGGHYGQHFDFFSLGEGISDKIGNRIATVLFYMSDVEQGGGTAFPYLKKLIKPQKGTAAVWYNLHASGDGDTWTKHGACPVIAGSKWALNRWIRERGQEFKRPCGLYSDVVENSVMF